MSKTTEVIKHLARFVTNWFENKKLAITVQGWISDIGIDGPTLSQKVAIFY